MRSLRRRPVVLGSLAATAVLGLTGVSAAALLGPHPAHPAAARVSSAPSDAPASTAVVTTTTPTAPTTSVTAPPPPPTSTIPPVTAPPTTVVPSTTLAALASLRVSPSTAAFPSTPPPYWPMPIVHVTVTNTGSAAVGSVVVHPVGVYSVPSSTCSTLAPGQSCGADVQFCPTSPGGYADTLTVTGLNAVTGAPLQATIALDGTAT